ncbi:RHS repeat-associated core domain-containing protein [Krasilnikovia sp. MM14-A1259]|uniref:RHS repeat-associated core domain-containing protein n=1 Tax=Krasilnikovia sp. MM14-A1259 TaxID=3373539 RepID=UPI0037F9952C
MTCRIVDRPVRSLALTAVLLILAALLPVSGHKAALAAPKASAALPSNPAHYSYDAAGRLTGASQDNSGSSAARYHYDANGNITSIDRYAASTLAISSLVPARAAPGATVTISGTGFATTTAGNTVAFNGTTATVKTASATALTVTVPSGAATGTVKVTTSAGTATSDDAFTVDAAPAAVTVGALTPAIGAAGASVSIFGTGFATTPAANTVTFGLTRAVITAATATRLTVTVPDAASSGAVTVATGGVSAQSAGDFIVVPRGYTADKIGPTPVLTADGASSTVNISSAGTVALLRFAGTKGQRLSLGLTGSTISTNFTVGAFSPYGAPYARGYYGYDKPIDYQHLYGAGLELPPLPSTGVYQVVIDPLGATGSVVATLSTRPTGTLDPSGPGTTLTLGRLGQLAEASFPATAGQAVDLGFTVGTLPAGTKLMAALRDPHGTTVFWGQDGITYQEFATDGGGDFDFTPAETGTYTVIFGVEGTNTGTVTVTESHPLAPVATSIGATSTITINRPGQDAQLTFTGTAGQQLGLDLGNYTFAYAPMVTLTAPDGSTVWHGFMSSLHKDFPALPATGTYLLRVSPEAQTGTFTVRLSVAGDAGAISPTGAAVNVPFSQAGAAEAVTFAATAGQTLDFALGGWSLPGTATVTATVSDPSGNVVLQNQIGANGVLWVRPTATGTYRLLMSVTDGHSTGAVSLTASVETDGGALTVAATKTVTSTRAGQSTRFTVNGTAGQHLSLTFTAYAYASVVDVLVIKPDGTVFANTFISTTQLDLDALPTAGTYTVIIGPLAQTGSTQLTLEQRIDAGATTVGGAAKTLSMSSAGSIAETSFTATAGQRLSFGFTGRTFPAATKLRTRVLDAAGTVLIDYNLLPDNSLDLTMPAAGTYRLLVAPDGFGTGSETFTLSAQVNAGTITVGGSKNLTFARAGQSQYLTFAGTAGQNLALGFTNVTTPYYPSVLVKKPDGSTLTSSGGAGTVNVATLPSSGTYEVTLSPYSATGAVTVTLATRSATAAPQVTGGKRSATQAQPIAPLPTPAASATAKALRPLKQPPQLGGTAAPPKPATTDTWTPDPRNLSGQDWTTHRSDPTRHDVTPPPLRAAHGATALAGRLLTLDGRPLKGAAVSIDSTHTTTDVAGRFLLSGLHAGHRVLRADGSTAGKYGLYDIGVDVTASTTAVLPYPIWMTRLDTAHEVTFPSPTSKDTVITTPAIPGLEVHLPAGTTVRDVNGAVVTKLGITAIPIDRPPFPLPSSHVPVYFTVQPGSSYVFPTGARVVYPNYTHAKPGASFDFWHYDPAGRGWFVYGHGKVTPDGKQVQPDAKTVVYQFTGAMLVEPGVDPPPDIAPTPDGGTPGADPVDLGTGQLLDAHTDLTVPDTMPISVTRTYDQSDTGRRAFGVGVNFAYNMYLYADREWLDGYVIMPNAARVHYHRITPGGLGGYDYLDAVFAADPTPTAFNGSVMAYNGNGFEVRLRDGTTYLFGEEAPLQAIRDRFGNTTTITRAPAAADPDGVVRAKGPITQITSPNGRWVAFSNDAAGRITRATDNTGRSVSYAYDANGHLTTVTDVNGGTTAYAYDGSGRIASIRDPRGTAYLTNTYDAAGRVAKQTLADGSTYQLAYTTGADGKITETRLADGRGQVRRVSFNADGYPVTDTAADGTPGAQTTTVARDSGSNLVTAVTDALNRRTEFRYDPYGNLTGVTQLAGTSGARTAAFTYGAFDRLTKQTDWLGHSTTYAYTADGALQTITDPLDHVTTVDAAEDGQVTKVTDALGKATGYEYLLGDPVRSTDSLGRVATGVLDGAGRVITATDPTGSTTRATYDAMGHALTVTDPLDQVASHTYDPNGNLTKVTDPRGNATAYTYDAMDRVTKVTDPLGRATSYTYDANGNPATVTDARGKLTRYTYDNLDRLTLVQFGATTGGAAESQTAYTYDAGNRVRTVVDSAGGTTTVTPDDLDRPTRVVSPQGQIDYEYDSGGRRTSMTVAGQPRVTYGYDNADELTSENQGSTAVTLGYDADGRRITRGLPSATQTYAYDAAGQLSSITYANGSATLGNLTYTYDADGRPVSLGGSYARTDIPAAFGPATYDAANQLATLGSATYTYDNAGDLTSDGTTSYGWNARGQLTSLNRTGLSVTFGYDGVGTRTSRTAGGATTGYLSDGYNLVQELSGTTPSANLLTGSLDDTFVRTPVSGSSQSLLTDGLGSTLATATGSGTIAGEYTYQPYGATTATGNDAGNTARFTGRTDDGTGLYYYRNRYYDPSSGRFLSPDPLGQLTGTNPYAYVNDQPTDLTDPFGLKPEGEENQGDPESCPSPNSFTGDTPVLMADGTTKPISRIKLGERVQSNDPHVGESGAHPVTALIRGDGEKRLIDVTLDGLQPSKALTATAGHVFWVDSDGNPNTPGGEWVHAGELRRGQWLRTADGHLVRVAGTHAHSQHATVYNLTVDDLHTYYVLAGTTPVLVHNVDLGALNSCPVSPTTHWADVSVHDSEGNIIYDYSVRSGAQRPSEAAVGRGGETLSHTENRVARMSGGVPSYGSRIVGDDEFFMEKPVPEGGHVVIQGSRPPCSSCQGAMNRAAEDTGSTFTYFWEHEFGVRVWQSTR